MYPEIMVIPMREELTRLGVQELRTVEEVDRAVVNQPGTTMVVVNSICGSHCFAKLGAPGQDVLGVCRTRQGSHRPSSRLLYGLSAVVAFDRAASRWEAGSHDPAQRH
jgi:putative YphP/YqiW family bacilliredoxin